MLFYLQDGIHNTSLRGFDPIGGVRLVGGMGNGCGGIAMGPVPLGFTKYYADPAQPNIGAVRVLDLL